MEPSTPDIHAYARQYVLTLAQVDRVGARNRKLLLAYRDALRLQNVCGTPRLVRMLRTLTSLARALDKDLDRATPQDLRAFLLSRQQAGDRATTMSITTAALRSFYAWRAHPDDIRAETPSLQWLRAHRRARDRRRLQRHELLTRDEAMRLAEAAQHPRDRALLMLLWESGARISELGNLTLRNLTTNAHGFTLDLTGKTGQRSILVVQSAPALHAWLAHHPRPEPSAPVWIHQDGRRHLGYQGVRKLLARVRHAAGITKRIHPHLFRHSRATYVLANGIMTEAQAKAYFGWTPGTDMLSTYSHLLASDASLAILRENGC